MRTVCHFSCGAASAIATKLTIAATTGELVILNAYIEEEHPDNQRFAKQCEQWFGKPITTLKNDQYAASTLNVFRTEQYIKGPYGASCTRALKRKLLAKVRQPGDINILGFTAEENERFEDFKDRNPDMNAEAPLIKQGLTKEDCKAMLERAGIPLPKMYQLGYENNNCIGCVKGGHGYFRAIREDFPEHFSHLAAVEKEIYEVHGENAYILKYESGPDKGKRFPLTDLPPGKIQRNQAVPNCGLLCELAEKEYST